MFLFRLTILHEFFKEIIAIRILASPRYCFITTREKFNSISAINLARAVLAKIEFQRDDMGGDSNDLAGGTLHIYKMA